LDEGNPRVQAVKLGSTSLESTQMKNVRMRTEAWPAGWERNEKYSGGTEVVESG